MARRWESLPSPILFEALAPFREHGEREWSGEGRGEERIAREALWSREDETEGPYPDTYELAPDDESESESEAEAPTADRLATPAAYEEARLPELFLADEDEVAPLPELRFENQVAAGQTFLALAGKVVIGDESSGVITATRIDLWLSSRDADPPNAGAFASAVPFVNGTNSSAPTQTSLQIAAGAPSFGLLVPVTPPAGQTATWRGFLIVRATWNHPRSGAARRVTRTARLPIELNALYTSPHRVVVLHPTAGAEYLWICPELVRASGVKTGKGSITVQIRDQVASKAHYRAVFALSTQGRPKLDNADIVVFGVPVETPCLIRLAGGDPGATLSLLKTTATSKLMRALLLQGRAYLPRAELKTFTPTNRTTTTLDIRMTPASTTQQLLTGKKVVLDPGHGVNYEFASQRRVYEWYVAHRVLRAARSVLELLGATVVFVPTARFQTQHVRIAVALSGITAADTVFPNPQVRLHIDRTRTPHQFAIEIVDATLSVAALGAALGYNEDANRDQFFTAYKTRAQFFADYSAFFATLVARAAIPAGFTLVPQSLAFNAGRYQVTVERTVGGNTERRQVTLTLRQNDRFDLLADEIRWLATASIWRAYQNEMGAPYRAVIGAANNQQQPSRALIDYATTVLTTQEGRSLGPTGRANFMAAQNGHAHVTCHHNAAGGDGVSVLVPAATAVNSPRARAGKRFLKYVDPLNFGKHGSGLKFSNSTLVTQAPATDYVYLEVEFMDTADASAPGGIRYGRMVDDVRFIHPTAEQIVAAVVEALTSPQSDAEIDAAAIGSPEQ